MTSAHPKGLQQPSWFRQNWKWAVPSIVLGSLALAAMIVCALIYTSAQTLIQSAAYQTALQEVGLSLLLQEKIGSPIVNSSWLPSGEIEDHGERGEARFNFEVRGPQGTAEIQTKLRKLGGTWSPTALDVKLPGEVVNTSLMKEVLARNPDDRPKFDPNSQSQQKVEINLPPPADLEFEDPAKSL
jgi:hypothetical protein